MFPNVFEEKGSDCEREERLVLGAYWLVLKKIDHMTCSYALLAFIFIAKSNSFYLIRFSFSFFLSSGVFSDTFPNLSPLS